MVVTSFIFGSQLCFRGVLPGYRAMGACR